MKQIQKEEIIENILSMPPMERIEIIDKVIESFNSNLPDKFEELWAAEVDKRVNSYLNGKISTLSATDVFRKINQMR